MKIDTNDTAALRLLANAIEAKRCVSIYVSEQARLRPVQAWQLLPLGKTAGETLAALTHLPIEDADANEVYLYHFNLLTAQSEAAEAMWKRYAQGGNTDVRYFN